MNRSFAQLLTGTLLAGAAALAVAQAPPSGAEAPGAGPGGPAGFGPPGAAAGGERSMSRRAPEGSEPPPADARDFSGVWTTVNSDQYSPFEVKVEYKGKVPEPGATGMAVPSVQTRECKPSAKFGGITYPMQIVSSPGMITLIQEEHRRTRRIYIDRPIPRQPTPHYYGTSVAHWEGDTLVVTTVGLKGEQEFGITATPDLRIVERIRKIENGTRLEDQLTYHRDKYWSKPATYRVRYNWRPDQHLMEYACEQFSDAFGRGYDSIR
ncbi:MAG: hypothetical protein QM718_12455 [Steroidobacteraceae bacterium]